MLKLDVFRIFLIKNFLIKNFVCNLYHHMCKFVVVLVVAC